MRSTQPFPETFRSHREMVDISEREVTARIQQREARPGFGHSTMNAIYAGHAKPLPHHLKAVAAVFGIDADTFAEYRLWQAVHLFDIVGDERRQIEPISFSDAMHNLALWEEFSKEAATRPRRRRRRATEEPVAPEDLAEALQPSQAPRAAEDEPA